MYIFDFYFVKMNDFAPKMVDLKVLLYDKG